MTEIEGIETNLVDLIIAICLSEKKICAVRIHQPEKTHYSVFQKEETLLMLLC